MVLALFREVLVFFGGLFDVGGDGCDDVLDHVEAAEGFFVFAGGEGEDVDGVKEDFDDLTEGMALLLQKCKRSGAKRRVSIKC